MPDLSPEWLEEMVFIAGRMTDLCVVTKDAAGKIHPLCAVYRSECLPLVRRALDGGQLKLLDLLKELRAVEMYTAAVIGNLNTPQQLAAHGERANYPLH